jgi:hypothetical protein
MARSHDHHDRAADYRPRDRKRTHRAKRETINRRQERRAKRAAQGR